MTQQTPIPKDIAERAERIYAEKIRETLTPEDKDKFCVIDVNSGAYEIDEKDIDASLRLLEQIGDGSSFFHIRIGYSTAYRFGRNSVCGIR